MNIEVFIDYRNMRFLVNENGKPIDLPFSGDIQEAIIRKLGHDICQTVKRQIQEQIVDDPLELEKRFLH